MRVGALHLEAPRTAGLQFGARQAVTEVSVLEVLRSPPGGFAIVLGAVAVVVGVLLWARAPEAADRRLGLSVAVVLTLLVSCIYALAVALGWWAGAYFETPLVVQAALLVSITLPGCLLWLATYSWLADHHHQALQICFAFSLLTILAVAIAHRLNLGRGAILVGPDLAIVWQAALGMLLLWLPIAMYEALRRGLERVTLP